jgi:hypothetical protein
LKGPKNEHNLKNLDLFFAFLMAILLGLSMVYCLFILSVVVDTQMEMFTHPWSRGHLGFDARD